MVFCIANRVALNQRRGRTWLLKGGSIPGYKGSRVRFLGKCDVFALVTKGVSTSVPAIAVGDEEKKIKRWSTAV